MKLLEFYQDVAGLVRRDLNKQKMLLPPDSIAELCSQHHRKHRSLAEKLVAGNTPCNIYAVQKAFPRSGTVNADFNALELAKSFAAEKAAALAVVTEKHYYGGEPSMLTGVAHLVDLPIIRWDFIVESYQLMQSKLWGADAVRIAVPLLDQTELADLYKNALALDLELIWEIHSAGDAERVAEFEQSRILYLDGDSLDADSAENILKNLSYTAPALLNGDAVDCTAIENSMFKGLVLFQKAIVK